MNDNFSNVTQSHYGPCEQQMEMYDAGASSIKTVDVRILFSCRRTKKLKMQFFPFENFDANARWMSADYFMKWTAHCIERAHFFFPQSKRPGPSISFMDIVHDSQQCHFSAGKFNFECCFRTGCWTFAFFPTPPIAHSNARIHTNRERHTLLMTAR